MGGLTKKHLTYISIGLLALGLVYFFFLRKKKETPELEDNKTSPAGKEPTPSKPVSSESPSTAVPVQTDSFPLKKGKKGKRVEQLQIWLINKYGKPSLPNYGVDGDWQDEVSRAVKKHLNRDNISETYFNNAGIGKFKTNIYK